MRIERALSVSVIICGIGLLIMDHIKHSQMPDPKPAVSDSLLTPTGDDSSQEPKPEPKNDPKEESMDGTIVMYTEDWCRPCRDWKSIELPKVGKAGWKVITRPASEGMRIPKFEVYGNGRMIEQTGYMTMPRLREIVNQLHAN